MSPANFHISVLNSTAVEATWQLPTSRTGLNGVVRGFKIYIEKINGSERIIDLKGADIEVFIITDLEPSAEYLFSILMYTVADGPQGVHLPLTMPDSSELINYI